MKMKMRMLKRDLVYRQTFLLRRNPTSSQLSDLIRGKASLSFPQRTIEIKVLEGASLLQNDMNSFLLTQGPSLLNIDHTIDTQTERGLLVRISHPLEVTRKTIHSGMTTLKIGGFIMIQVLGKDLMKTEILEIWILELELGTIILQGMQMKWMGG